MTSKEALEYVKMCCSDGLQLPQNQSVEQILLIGNSLATIEKDLEVLEILKKDLLYLQKNGVGLYIFPNNRKILGIDITDSPSEVEIRKQILEDTIKNII